MSTLRVSFLAALLTQLCSTLFSAKALEVVPLHELSGRLVEKLFREPGAFTRERLARGYRVSSSAADVSSRRSLDLARARLVNPSLFALSNSPALFGVANELVTCSRRIQLYRSVVGEFSLPPYEIQGAWQLLKELRKQRRLDHLLKKINLIPAYAEGGQWWKAFLGSSIWVDSYRSAGSKNPQRDFFVDTILLLQIALPQKFVAFDTLPANLVAQLPRTPSDLGQLSTERIFTLLSPTGILNLIEALYSTPEGISIPDPQLGVAGFKALKDTPNLEEAARFWYEILVHLLRAQVSPFLRAAWEGEGENAQMIYVFKTDSGINAETIKRLGDWVSLLERIGATLSEPHIRDNTWYQTSESLHELRALVDHSLQP